MLQPEQKFVHKAFSMKRTFFLFCFLSCFINSIFAQPSTNGGGYQIFSPSNFDYIGSYGDTTVIECKLFYLTRAITRKAFKGHTVFISGKEYKTDSNGTVQIRLPEGKYSIIAKPSKRLSSATITTERFYFRKRGYYNIYIYFIQDK